jgi:hypothetical protein
MSINKAIREFDLGRGSLKNEDVNSFVSLVNASHKWASLKVQIYCAKTKNDRILKNCKQSNIADDTTAIDLGLGDPEVDKVKCPVEDKIITRADCLDYSGANYDLCGNCEIGKATKEMLLPAANG